MIQISSDLFPSQYIVKDRYIEKFEYNIVMLINNVYLLATIIQVGISVYTRDNSIIWKLSEIIFRI